MLSRVLKDDRCLYVIFVGPAWHGFEDYARRQDRDGRRRLLLKTVAVPLPWFLREVKRQPENLKTEKFPRSVDIAPIMHLGNHSLAVSGIALNDGQSPNAGDIEASEVECTENSTKYSMSVFKTPYQTSTFDTDLTTPCDLHTATYRGDIQQTELENSLVQENYARALGADCRSPRPGVTNVNIRESSTQSRRSGQRDSVGRAFNVIPRNRVGQRIDPLIKSNKDLRLKMSGEKWCSNYQLKGLCPIKNCIFRHGPLDDAGKNTLLSLARGNPCRNGNGCDGEDCFAGHHCPYNPCKKGKRCSFSRQQPDMHIQDKRIVNFEDLSQPGLHRPRNWLGNSQPRAQGNWH